MLGQYPDHYCPVCARNDIIVCCTHATFEDGSHDEPICTACCPAHAHKDRGEIMSTIINANEYSAATQVVTDAINRSISHNEIVRIDGYDMRDAIIAELREACEFGVKNNDDQFEFFGERHGEDDDGPQHWRVHVTARGGK